MAPNPIGASPSPSISSLAPPPSIAPAIDGAGDHVSESKFAKLFRAADSKLNQLGAKIGYHIENLASKLRLSRSDSNSVQIYDINHSAPNRPRFIAQQIINALINPRPTSAGVLQALGGGSSLNEVSPEAREDNKNGARALVSELPTSTLQRLALRGNSNAITNTLSGFQYIAQNSTGEKANLANSMATQLTDIREAIVDELHKRNTPIELRAIDNKSAPSEAKLKPLNAYIDNQLDSSIARTETPTSERIVKAIEQEIEGMTQASVLFANKETNLEAYPQDTHPTLTTLADGTLEPGESSQFSRDLSRDARVLVVPQNTPQNEVFAQFKALPSGAEWHSKVASTIKDFAGGDKGLEYKLQLVAVAQTLHNVQAVAHFPHLAAEKGAEILPQNLRESIARESPRLEGFTAGNEADSHVFGSTLQKLEDGSVRATLHSSFQLHSLNRGMDDRKLINKADSNLTYKTSFILPPGDRPITIDKDNPPSVALAIRSYDVGN